MFLERKKPYYLGYVTSLKLEIAMLISLKRLKLESSQKILL